MARTDCTEIPPRDPRKELIARLESAPSEHAEALLDAYELLQELYDRRVLETVRGALSASDKLTESATRVAKFPSIGGCAA